jgi:YVTN family beta-propeller protein
LSATILVVASLSASLSTSLSSTFSRRTLLASVLAAGCGRKRASRYQGWLFVASGQERAIAVANLAEFRQVTRIALPHAPDELILALGKVHATSREGAELIEVDPEGFRVAGRIALPGKPVAARLLTDGLSILVLTEEPATVVIVDLSRGRVTARTNLPAVPAQTGLGGGVVAVTLPSRQSIMRISTPDLKVVSETAVGGAGGVVRFRKDEKTILSGIPSTREIVTLDARTGVLLTRLPLPIEPLRFCFNRDGGQMFVTGTGEDSLVIVNPYQNEVDQTILAGRTPGAMAVSERQNFLFVANPGSGDLTILDIDTRHLSATVHVGGRPGEVILTPDGEYALVVDPGPGTVSVVRIATALDRSQVALVARPPKPLFTVFETAADARSAVIVPFPV